MGGKSDTSNPAAETQARLAQQLFSQTDPLRQSLIGRSEAFLGGGASPGTPTASSLPSTVVGAGLQRFRMIPGPNGISLPQMMAEGAPAGGPTADVTNSPTYAALKSSADHNFSQAKDNMIARFGPGGGLIGALGGLEANRASAMTQGAGLIFGDELSRAMGLATGGSVQGLSGLGSAGALQAQAAQQAASDNQAKAGGLGTALGGIAGGMVGSAFPGVGTVAGAKLGATIGGGAGYAAGS